MNRLTYHSRHTLFWVVFIGLLSNTLMAEGFDAVYGRIKGDVSSASETDVSNMIKFSIEENHVEKGMVVFKEWLELNIPQNHQIFYHAGRALEKIGQYKQAQPKYLSFLQKAKPGEQFFDEAAGRHARILFHRINGDATLLRQYMVGHKSPSTWKYDRLYWAKITDYRKRMGPEAEMSFLISCIESGMPKERLLKYYWPMFEFTLSQTWERFNNVRQKGKFASAEKLSLKLTEALKFDPELHALFKWKTANYSYFLERDKSPDDKNIKYPIKEAEELLKINPDYIPNIALESLHGWQWGGRWPANVQEEKKKIEAFVAQAYKKASPYFQLYSGGEGKPADLPHRHNLANQDKAFMAKIKGKKISIEEASAIITNQDPKKISYIPYVLGLNFKVDKHNFSGMRVDRVETHHDLRRFGETRHPMHAPVVKALEASLKGKPINPRLISALITMMGTSHTPTRKIDADLMRKIVASPSYKKLPIHQRTIINHRYWSLVINDESTRIAGDIGKLTKTSTAEEVTSALSSAKERAQNSWLITSHAPGAHQLRELSKDVVSKPEVYKPLMDYLVLFPSSHDLYNLDHVTDAIIAGKDYETLYTSAFHLWQTFLQIHHENRRYPVFIPVFEKLLDENPSAAAMLARNALQIIRNDTNRNNYRNLRSKGKIVASNILNKAEEAMGIVTIPVPKTDPNYPLFLSQQQLGLGNEGNAWKILKENSLQLMDAHRQLKPSFLLWVIEQLTKISDQEEELIALRGELMEACKRWISEDGPFALSQQVMLELYKGDILLGEQKSINASAVYRDIMKNKAYSDEPTRFEAHLRLADLERKAKNFEAALNTIEELLKADAPSFKIRALMSKARILFDKGDFEEAKDIIADVKARNPMYNEASLLEGEIMIKENNFRPGYQVAIGDLNAKEWITTGEKLQITLNDPGLTSSGGGTIIEVDVWSSSGDKETVVLGQSGDAKHLFSGAIPISLGMAAPRDSILQVVGDDTVQYAYNKQFAERMKLDDLGVSPPIRIKSDAEISIASRPLLSRELQAAEDVRFAKELKTFKIDPTRMNEENYQKEFDKALDSVRRLYYPPLKPGNPIYLRVIDEDRSRTKEIDEVVVNVRSSGGDSVNRVVLKETGTHTGVFDGSLPSRKSLPGVVASKASAGKNPNSLISPKEYEPWTSVPFTDRSPVDVVIDLNDNVELGEMRIVTRNPEAKLKNVKVRTGMNREDLTTIGHFPDNSLTVKALYPSVTLALQRESARRWYDYMINPVYLKPLQSYLSIGVGRAGRITRDKSSGRIVFDKGTGEHVSDSFRPRKVAKNISGPSKLMENINLEAWGSRPPGHGWPVVSAFKAHFYEKDTILREFIFSVKENASSNPKDKKSKRNKQNGIPYLHILINGQEIAKGDAETLKGSIRLQPGLHTLEIITAATSKEMHSGQNKFSIEYNGGEGGKMVPCPDSVFDPSTFPKHATGFHNKPAKVEKKGNELVVKFAPDSKARIIALQFADQKGAQVSIDKIHLTSKDGKAVLPLDTDYQELAKNRTLEVLIGDSIQVVYNDDRFVGQKEPTSVKKYEKLLSVNYSDASIGIIGGHGYGRETRYRRFAYGTLVPIKVTDSDKNLTREQDSLDVKVLVSGQKNPLNISISEMISTNPHTKGQIIQGVFQGYVTPVKNIKTAREKRKQAGDDTPLINPVEVPSGGSLTFIYHDEENRRPGIPIDRIVGIDHAKFEMPIVKMATVTTEAFGNKFQRRGAPFIDDLTPPIPRTRGRDGSRGAGDRVEAKGNRKARSSNFVGSMARPTFTYHDVTEPPEGGFNVYMGLMARVKVRAPHMVLTAGAKLDVFLQSESTRRRYKSGDLEEIPDEFSFGEEIVVDELDNYGDHRIDDEEEYIEPLPEQTEASKAIFNLDIPGTIRIRCYNSVERPRWTIVTPQHRFPPYLNPGPFFNGYGETQDGVFEGAILVKSGQVDLGWLDTAKEMNIKPPLFVTPKDSIHLGFRYTDEDGAEQWITAKAKVKADGFLDVMDQSYSYSAANILLGQRVYTRVADMGRDKSTDMDETTVHISSKSGAKTFLTLNETESNSGVFKGSFFLTYAENPEAAAAMIDDPANQTNGRFDVSRKGFPVVYGDSVRVRYKDSEGNLVPFHELNIADGADGEVIPFTKQYSDSGMAMEAQFSMAEAYLELAKRHRSLAKDAKKAGNHSYAKKCLEASEMEFARAKDLLELAINSFNDPEPVAHAHYMLGLLLYEDANAISKKDIEKREDMFQAALQRFVKVSGTYADTSFGSKAQFKKAMTYEKLREPDIAAAEYVKLAYKYPDSEFLGTAMARLGFHFLRKANDVEKKFKSFIRLKALEDVIDERRKPPEVELSSWLDAQDMRKELRKEFYKSATILGKMINRFPSHELATKCGLTAGHAFRKSGKIEKAIQTYKLISSNQGYDPDSRSQAMYWRGRIFLERGETMRAYTTLMQITVDFPETKWAANARAELAKPKMVELDSELQMDRLK